MFVPEQPPFFLGVKEQMIGKQIRQDKQTYHSAPLNQVNYLIQPKLNLSIGSSLFTSVAIIVFVASSTQIPYI